MLTRTGNGLIVEGECWIDPMAPLISIDGHTLSQAIRRRFAEHERQIVTNIGRVRVTVEQLDEPRADNASTSGIRTAEADG
jgi:hypothetical protein